MKTSESITKIAPAFLKAQQKIGSAKKGSENPFFHSKYADLGSIMEACKEALNENKIAVLQPTHSDEFGTFVETILLHESGEYFSSLLKVTAKTENNPQDQGSAQTYARRYALQSMLFIPAEDDDGNKASGNGSNVASSQNCPRCGNPMVKSKTGSQYCPGKYNGSCNPKPEHSESALKFIESLND